MALKIGWLTPTVKMNGAVREMVETCNVLVSRSHQVTIYHPHGGPCEWLPCRAATKALTALRGDRPDVLVGMTDWKPDMHQALDAATAKVKCICVVGFTPTADLAQVWTGKKKPRDSGEEMQRRALSRYHVLTDSSWQRAWLREQCNIQALPAFGGVNLEQFHPVPQTHRKGYLLVGMTGDPRARKGSEIVLQAFNLIKKERLPVRRATYWGLGIAQDKLRDWYSNCDVFLDAERVAGWANPVAEAMACGVAVVSADIGAVHDFAQNGKTALLVPLGDTQEMANAAIALLKNDTARRQMAERGLERIKQFSYDKVVPPLEKELQRLVDAGRA